MQEYIFINGTILTMGEAAESPEAVLVRNSRLAFVGSKRTAYARAKTYPTLIDLKGRILLPAFTDVHTHLVEYAKRQVTIDLSCCRTMEHIQAALLSYLKRNAGMVSWITGSGWDKNILDRPDLLTSDWLDGICAQLPVALQSKDYHAKWCNSLALQLARIDKDTPNPPGGLIAKDILTGAPTGLLFESASALMDTYIEPIPADTLIQAIRKVIREAWSYGLCGAHLMETEQNWDLAVKALSGSNPFQLCWWLPEASMDKLSSDDTPLSCEHPWISYGGVKLYLDGALGSQTAAMFEPYPESGNCGILRYSEAELKDILLQLHSRQVGAAIHAIGDKAVHTAIKVLLDTRQPNSLLFNRIEYAQCVRGKDIKLLQDSGIYISLQPVHLANDIPLIKQHWAQVEDRAYTFADIVRSGVVYGFGSDVPVETFNPFLGIYTALTRKPLPQSKGNTSTSQTDSDTAFHPEQCLNLQEALFGYTLGAAFGSNSQHTRGSIAVGKFADLLVLDYFINQPETFWLSAKSKLTMVNGMITHSEIDI